MTGFFLMDLAASIPYDMIISLSDDGTGEVPLGTDATKAPSPRWRIPSWQERFHAAQSSI